MSLRLARRCHFPAPTSARTSSVSSVSRVKRIAPRHSVRRSQWKSSCVGSSNSALSVIGDCSSTSSPNEACLGCFEELSLSYELHNFRDTTDFAVRFFEVFLDREPLIRLMNLYELAITW